MRTRLLKRTTHVGLAITCIALTMLVAAPAGADVHPAHPGVIIAAAGSDTTEQFMDQILNQADEYNIHAQQNPTLAVPATHTAWVPPPTTTLRAPACSTRPRGPATVESRSATR